MSRWTTPNPSASVALCDSAYGRQARTGVHLTHRGRVMVLLVLLCLVMAAFMAGRSASQAATAAAPQPALAQTTVQAGDTLWSVAKRVAPGHDPREVVGQLRRLNHLDSAGVRVGQQLVLPRPA